MGYPGYESYCSVRALTVYNGELIAAGAFTTAGGVTCNYIARWDGTSWQPLGTGMGYPGYESYCSVRALTVYNGNLIAAGAFTTAGGVTCNCIARWNGTAWQPLGTGMSYYTSLGTVDALTVYNGELIAGGYFTTADGVSCNYIARWNGTAWQPLGTGMSSTVLGLTLYNSELIAGGDFTTAGGVTVNYIARWDATSWQPLGTGMSGTPYHDVLALTVYNAELIAGGKFTTAGGVAVNRIARWDGTSWQSLGTGVSGPTNPYVCALTVYNGELIAGGFFTTAGGNVSAYSARWTCTGACCQPDRSCAVTTEAVCTGVWHGEWSSCNPNPCPRAGDFDADGDVDIEDFNALAACLAGCQQPLGQGCEPGDMDADGDVDLVDFAQFQRAFGQ
jgi:hypothetical protein